MSTENPTLAAAPQRLVSLDVFRGITIAGMILVNNPGNWGHIYGPLKHASWNGWTPTDLVFPFFLFIVGVAMTYSFRRRRAGPGGRPALLVQVVRRTLLLFLLGLIMYGFPDLRLIAPFVLVVAGLPPACHPGAIDWRKGIGLLLVAGGIAFFATDFAYFNESHLRVPGVLQRIAACYFVASLIMMGCGVRGQALWALGLLAAYGAIVSCLDAPTDFVSATAHPEARLHDWIDVQVLGQHLYRERPDPEGLLSTLPAVATTLCGALAGHWIQANRKPAERAVGLFFAGNLALIGGMVLDWVFPINKKIWSCAYVVLTAGLALHFLAMCYWLIDVRSIRRWGWPFVVFGSNAIVVFVASSLAAKMLGRWQIATGEGTMSAHGWCYAKLLSLTGAANAASLAYALSYIAIWLVLMIPLYRRRIFVKV